MKMKKVPDIEVPTIPPWNIYVISLLSLWGSLLAHDVTLAHDDDHQIQAYKRCQPWFKGDLWLIVALSKEILE